MKKIFTFIFIGVMCFALTGCGDKENTGNGETSGKYNDSLESLIEGYCKVYMGEEGVETEISLYPPAKEEHARTWYFKYLEQGKYNWKECTYEIEFERTEEQRKTLEKVYSERHNTEYHFKDCKSIKMYSGELYYPDNQACQLADSGKWYLFY